MIRNYLRALQLFVFVLSFSVIASAQTLPAVFQYKIKNFGQMGRAYYAAHSHCGITSL